MVIIITGSTHTGKTALAQRLLEKYKYPYLSIDHLKMGLIRSGNTSLTVSDNEKLTFYLWNIVREMIKTAIENEQNLIVEGCYVPFNWKEDFIESYLNQIKYCCLIMTEKYITEHYDSIKSNAGIIENRIDDGYATMEILIQENKYYFDNCKKHSCNYYLIDERYEINLEDILK